MDLEVPAAGVTCVLGPSGSGKTTLLRLCNRLAAPTDGIVRFRGVDVAGVDPLRLRRQVGMVFQRPVVFGGSVRDNLAVAAPGAGDDAYAEALGKVELGPDLLRREAASLSGGEAQRMALARTLITGPDALLADEPTSSVDHATRSALERVARELASAGVPLLWVTHDVRQARRLADRLVLVRSGVVIAAGTPDRLMRDPRSEIRSALAEHEEEEDGDGPG